MHQYLHLILLTYYNCTRLKYCLHGCVNPLPSYSHFAHEKAKEIVDREREVVKAQLAAELATSSSPSVRRSAASSPSKSSSTASRAASPLQQQGSNWLSFLNSLSLLTNVEKDYWNLAFVGGSQPSSGLAISFQVCLIEWNRI